jgi:eukaryotic-like serine/threonine-protein kinase
MSSTFSPGALFGRYEIISKIGAGGMGEVYLAKDTELGRKVALKILPADSAQDIQRMQRFIQEARSASAFSHQNVAHIYEVTEANGLKLIAMEYVEGQTLRQHLAGGRMRIGKALETAIQVAAALAAAHASGIIHRDIKPENIVLRPDDFVKVLDFGLAKLTNKAANRQPSDSDASTLIGTDPGIVMGTVSYMSPEQARGLTVDERTDVFSLGVVLYEMVAGRRPFGGATTSDMIVSILEKEPVPLKQLVPDGPAELERIVGKALAKDAEDRYQTIKDLLIDLRQLKRRLEVEAGIERSAPSETEGVIAKSGEQSVAPSGPERPSAVTAIAKAAPTSGVGYLISGIKRHKTGAALISAVLVIALAGLGYVLYRFAVLPKSNGTASFHSMKIARLTNTGKATLAAVSPDGKYVVHAMSDGGQRSLWLRNVATSSNVQIIPPAEVEYFELMFSKDGNFIYYTSAEMNKQEVALYRVPVLGGGVQKIMSNVGTGRIDFSPDETRIAFERMDRNRNEDALMIANADGTGERTLATHKAEFWFGDPAWSPDGGVIVSSLGNVTAEGFYMTLVAVSVKSGEEKVIPSQRWGFIESVAWLADGSGLVISAVEPTENYSQVWQISYPGGASRRITNDLNNYSGVSLTADSGGLVSVQSEKMTNAWVSANGSDSSLRQITDGGVYSTPTWTPDGKILYSSRAGGNSDIWIMEADGSGQRQLTSDKYIDFYPAASPDGRNIAYLSAREGNPSLWNIDISGGEPKQLDNHIGGGYPIHFSSDGKWVIYTKLGELKAALWKVPIDGGQAARLTESSIATSPAVSPDGKLIACYYVDQLTGKRQLALVPFESGQPLKTFELPPTIYPSSNLRWTTDGHAIAYIDTRKHVSNIWAQAIEGGPPKQLTDFKNDQIFYFDWSIDGKRLVLARGAVSNDVVLISNVK